MAEPFLAEIRIVAFNFPPRGNAFCDGQILPINQNQSLFSLLGTTYGGDGRTTFGLPELRGRVPIHTGTAPGGSNHVLGQKGGEENVTLNGGQLPSHTHDFEVVTTDATDQFPLHPSQNMGGSRLAKATTNMYGTGGTQQALNPASVTAVGGGQPHTNMQPFLAVNFCIALQGLFPSRN